MCLHSINSKYNPKKCILEKLFIGNNINSVLNVSKMIGGIYLFMLLNKIPIYEYSPNAIKGTIIGSILHKEKRFMKSYVEGNLNIDLSHLDDHAIDSLGAIITHIFLEGENS